MYTVDFPCKVNDEVYVICTCNDVEMIEDYSVGSSDCPFADIADGCSCIDCDAESQKVILKTTVDMFYNSVHAITKVWLVSLKGIYTQYELSDFGKVIFLSKEEALKNFN